MSFELLYAEAHRQFRLFKPGGASTKARIPRGCGATRYPVKVLSARWEAYSSSPAKLLESSTLPRDVTIGYLGGIPLKISESWPHPPDISGTHSLTLAGSLNSVFGFISARGPQETVATRC